MRVTPAARAVEAPAAALRPVEMSRALVSVLDADAGTTIVAAELLSVAPGRRAVIGYRTDGGTGEEPDLIGKCYTDPRRAQRLHDLLTELWTAGVAVPRPLAHLPELRMTVYRACAGRPLDALTGGELEAGVVAAAGWLATLHAARPRLDRRFDVAVECHNIRGWAGLVAGRRREGGRAIARLSERLCVDAAQLSLSAAGPIHKDFHHRHVLAGPGGVSVIDVDEVRAGDPACDVAHFAAYLRLLALRGRLTPAEAASLESTFVAEYASRTGYREDGRHRWFGAYTCMKIARQLVSGRGPVPPASGDDLGRQVEMIIEDGLRWLSS